MKVEQVQKIKKPFHRLVYWIGERERIRLKRLPGTGHKAPWTDDVILQTYRFCNVRRMDDKVSQWLLTNWYDKYKDHPNMVAAVALARFINLPSSLVLLTDLLFRKSVYQGPLWTTIKEVLRKHRDKGNVIFNGAYMVRGNDGMDKIECVVDYYVRPLIETMTPPGSSSPQLYRDSMQRTWELVCTSYGMGSFMAGQVVADLRWAITGDWADAREWAPAGPGSQRGLNRLRGYDVKRKWKQGDFVEALQELINELTYVENLGFVMDRLEAIDVQNCLCEFDKYERTLWGQSRPKQLYRPIQ